MAGVAALGQKILATNCASTLECSGLVLVQQVHHTHPRLLALSWSHEIILGILGVDIVIKELLVLPVDLLLWDLNLGLLLGELPLKQPVLPLLPQVLVATPN